MIAPARQSPPRSEKSWTNPRNPNGSATPFLRSQAIATSAAAITWAIGRTLDAAFADRLKPVAGDQTTAAPRDEATTSVPAGDWEMPGTPTLAETFAALLAGKVDAPTREYPAAPAITDEIVEQVSRRVLAELSERVVRETVSEIVSAIAERLVREEIERIKASIK